MTPNQLTEKEYPQYYSSYVTNLEQINLIEYLEISLHEFIKFVRNIPLDKYDYKYAPDKWTIRGIIQHIIDAERIFAYRALRISRNDLTPLSSFDENYYADQVDSSGRSISSLLSELAAVRESTLFLFKNFNENDLQKTGIAAENEISVGALGFIIIGHQRHHQKNFEERYL